MSKEAVRKDTVADEFKVSRRSFLKIQAVAAGGVVASGQLLPAKASSLSIKDKKPFTPFRRVHERIEDVAEISPDLKRMDQRNTVFSRAIWDKQIQAIFMSLFGKKFGIVSSPLRGKPGHMPYDVALSLAAQATNETGAPFMAPGMRGGGVLNDWSIYSNPQRNWEKYRFNSPDEAAKYLKRASSFLGADLVGIAPYDERWTYKTWFDFTKECILDPKNNKPKVVKGEFPFNVKSVIAFAIEHDYDALMSPGQIADASSMLGYSRMAEVAHKIAVFLNSLGYKAIPTGNDTGLSIPIAIQAGLGEMSRMGTLITEKYGSRVRLAKVYTDLEITPDKPVTFGVEEFCKKCKKCADECPSNAISLEAEPSFKPTVKSVSSHTGVKKWFQDNERCISQWDRNSGGCAICMAVCPYNKLDTWVHDMAKILVGAPVGRDVARQLDDAFGYGEISDQRAKEFWNS